MSMSVRPPIGKRAEDVEDRAHAKFASHRRDMAHRRMMDWANMKTKPVSAGSARRARMQLDCRTRDSSTSALPELDDTLRFACLAPWAPQRRETNMAAVEMLKVLAPSPRCRLSTRWRLFGHVHLRCEFAHHGGRSGDLVDVSFSPAGRRAMQRHHGDTSPRMTWRLQLHHLIEEYLAMDDGAACFCGGSWLDVSSCDEVAKHGVAVR